MILSQLLYYTLPSADGPDAISASLTETRPVACCWSDCGRQVRSNGGESNFNLTPVCSISGNSRSGGSSTRRALQDASPAGFQQRRSLNISGVGWRHGKFNLVTFSLNTQADNFPELRQIFGTFRCCRQHQFGVENRGCGRSWCSFARDLITRISNLNIII